MRAMFLALGLTLAFCDGAFADAVSDCNQNRDLDLSIRGRTLIKGYYDRDLNAARNILALGHRVAADGFGVRDPMPSGMEPR